MQESPLREMLAQHERHVDGRFDRLESHITRVEKKLDDHTHGGYVRWSTLIPVLMAVVGYVFTVA